MISKIVFLFLAFMAVLAMFGKLRTSGNSPLDKLKSRLRIGSQKCPHCGRHKIGKGPCPCRKGAR